MDKAQAIHSFWSGFGLTAYDAATVPTGDNAPRFPYLTYDVAWGSIGAPVALTPLEFSILWYLCEHKGKVISSEELFEQVWGEKYLDNSNNTVMTHIGRLREKLNEPAGKPKFVKTVWGVGYTVE